ncbi:hypothetical protein ACS0TY_035953 [Phlomoides rotata]
MSAETPFGENAGEIKAVSTVTDLDFGIGELSVSPLPYEFTWDRADESSATMVTSDVSAADGLLSAFDSISFSERPGLRNDTVKNTIQSDAVGSGCESDLPSQKIDEEQGTSAFDSSDFVKVFEPSLNGDVEAEVVDEIDKPPKSNDHLVVYASSRRNSACNNNTKLIQNNDSQKPLRNRRTFAQQDSESDLKSLQISRRRRSLFPKQARSFVWGSVGLPAFEEHSVLGLNSGNMKKIGRTKVGNGKRNAIRDQRGPKSEKSCTATRHISLKIKIGNQSCGVVKFTENFNASRKNIPGLCDIMDSAFEEKLLGDVVLPSESNLKKVIASGTSVLGTHLNGTGNAENKSFSTGTDLHQITSHEEGGNLRASTGNRSSDPGTSPDSEVINSVPDAPLYEKGLQDNQVMTMERSRPECYTNSVPDVSIEVFSCSPGMKSREGKKKDKHYQFADCSIQNKVSGAETECTPKAPAELGPRQKGADVPNCGDASFVTSVANPVLNIYSSNQCPAGGTGMTNSGTSFTLKKVHVGGEGNPSSGFADGSESSIPQGCCSLIPCSNVQKSPKCYSAKEGRKSRSGVLGLPNKKGKASKKKGDKINLVVKRQIDEMDEINGLFSGVESHLEAGNRTSFDPGETGDLSKDSSGLINSLPVSSGLFKGQHAPQRNAWVLCDECQKWRRIPATLADEIGETNARWTCKDNMDYDFADCSIPQEKSNSDINEELEISDVSCDEDAPYNLLKSNKNKLDASKSLSWSLIRSNMFLHRSRKTQTIDEVMVCHCKPPSDGRMGCGPKCLNRMLNIECVEGTCPCGELCSNQQFQKRIHAKLKWFKCGKKGFGLLGLQDISEGQFVIEYVGEVLNIHAYEARQREYALQGHRHFYFMTLNGSEVIDACAKGNLGRYINHSCDPNCRTEKWMVNGEVCVGLFAIRDIKKGEELTFDYNYVRVFGAAAKKCVCGSPNCRGYIGGDPTNSEVIVHGDSDDEYAEPVMICEDRGMNDEWNDIMSHSLYEKENISTNEPQENRYRMKKVNAAGQSESITAETINEKVGVNATFADGCLKTSTATWVADTTVGHKYQPDDFVGNNMASNAAFGPSATNKDTGKSLSSSSSATLKVESEGLLSQMHSPVKLMDVSFQPESIVNGSMSSALPSTHEFDMSTTSFPSKSLPDKIKSKKKLKYGIMGGKEEITKSHYLVKTQRSSSSIKKEKLKSNIANEKGTPDVDKSNGAPHKSKKLPALSLNSQLEAVEGKLNELLDTEGGISKRKDASRGYLKLLFLTAASGTSGHGEAIQSNRDLSMILDALLKTKSRTVLFDIINRNGLQMLHNIMKRYRKEFIKTPILRKLLKVLEYLAVREILTLEHITGGPPCPGVESFKDSILTLTEHADRQVYQIARNFRDRWIPRSLRKNCFLETDDRKVEFHQQSSYGKLSVSSGDRSGKPSESTECYDTQVVASGAVDHSPASGCSNGTNGTRIRKRKSRWDNPADEYVHPRIRTGLSGDGIDEDAPPGFSSPCKVSMGSTALDHQERDTCVKHPCNIILADFQERFIACMPVTYGVPSSVVKQFGALEAEAADIWSVAPGLPFHPFPPLPPSINNKEDQPTSSFSEAVDKADLNNGVCFARHSDKKRTTWSSDAPMNNNLVANELPDFQQEGYSGNLGRKYFRQHKLNHSKLPPPWIRMRNGWGSTGNPRNSIPGVGFGNGANQFVNPYFSGDFNWRGEF